MAKLFEMEVRGVSIAVTENAGKFRIWTGIVGGAKHLNMTKPTLKGAIGYAKRLAAS